MRRYTTQPRRREQASGKYQYECPSSDSKYLYPAASETLPKMLALSSSSALVSIASYLLGGGGSGGAGVVWGWVYGCGVGMGLLPLTT